MLLSRMPSGDPEIFATVQGEGPSCGTPAVFVRLAECNLRCAWCDTKYTWDWANHDKAKETTELADDALVARVRSAAGEKTRTVVVTGGEPLLQQAELGPVLRALDDEGFAIEIETNGTIAPTGELAALVDRWNVSPKLAGSGNSLKARHRPTALAAFASLPNATFKLVVGSREELAEADELARGLDVSPERIVLMPEGTDHATLAERSRWLADECVRRGFRLGARLHVFVWGAERGR
ncbi:MAG TPA: 7-carboxy-7-deazaguanine synthase QueE [Labilithrix sp.]